MFQTIVEFARRNAVLIATTLILLILIAIFHEIMQPFVIALIVVYLIDPLVTRMNRIHIKKWRIPRGFAVIVAYLLFLASVVGIGFAFIPSLTTEISTASEALPKYFMRVKDEDIPRWSEQIDDLIFTFSRKSPKDIETAVEASKQSLDSAFDAAQTHVRNLPESGADGTVVQNDQAQRKHGNPQAAAAAHDEGVLFRVRKTSSNTYEFLPGDREIRLESDQKGSFVLKNTVADAPKTQQTTFNLEREITKAASDFLESSTQYAGSALSFIQNAIVFVINTFVQLILVFMLAAFISIDSPRLMAKIRALFENKEGEAAQFDDFKTRLARGLSGVVRGQLIICCINGTLTGLGLWIFGVDFSLLLGFIAGTLSIVPIFGTIISTIPAVLLGLVQGPIVALLVLAWILVVHFIDTNFFTPKIVGSSANLHPVIIIFALLAGQFAAGVLGLILAVPTASVIQTTITFILESTQKTRSETQVKTLTPSLGGLESVPASRMGYRVMTTASDSQLPPPNAPNFSVVPSTANPSDAPNAPNAPNGQVAQSVANGQVSQSAANGQVAQSATNGQVAQSAPNSPETAICDVAKAGDIDTTQASAIIDLDSSKTQEISSPESLAAIYNMAKSNATARPVTITAAMPAIQAVETPAPKKSNKRSKNRPTIHKGK